MKRENGEKSAGLDFNPYNSFTSQIIKFYDGENFCFIHYPDYSKVIYFGRLPRKSLLLSRLRLFVANFKL